MMESRSVADDGFAAPAARATSAEANAAAAAAAAAGAAAADGCRNLRCPYT